MGIGGRYNPVSKAKMLDAGTPADHTLIRADGTDGITMQTTGIIVDDSNNMSGINDILAVNAKLTGFLYLEDSTTNRDLIIRAEPAKFSADRTLQIDLSNGNRILRLVGNPILGDWFDQAVKATSSPAFNSIGPSGNTALLEFTSSTVVKINGVTQPQGNMNFADDKNIQLRGTGKITLSGSGAVTAGSEGFKVGSLTITDGSIVDADGIAFDGTNFTGVGTFSLGASDTIKFSAASQQLTIAGLGGTNNENLIFDFDTATANQVAITSGTGVDEITWTGIFKAERFYTENATKPGSSDGAAFGSGCDASGAGAFAAGFSSTASGTNTIAAGREVTATALNAGAFGAFCDATVDNALIIAIGGDSAHAVASGNPSVVVGVGREGKAKTNDLSATAGSSVALGIDVSATAINTFISGIGFTNAVTATAMLGYEEEGLRFTTTETVINDGGLDLDYRIESNTEDKLFLIDAGLDVVRMGDGDTNYTQFDSTGDLTFVGTAGLPYGEMYTDDNAVDTVLAAQDTWYDVTIFSANGLSNLTTVDHTDDTIKIVKAGVYLVTVSLDMRSSASNSYYFSIFKGKVAGTEFHNLETRRTTTVADKPGSVSMSGLIDVVVDNTVSLGIKRTDGGGVSKSILLEHANVTIVMIGGI